MFHQINGDLLFCTAFKRIEACSNIGFVCKGRVFPVLLVPPFSSNGSSCSLWLLERGPGQIRGSVEEISQSLIVTFQALVNVTVLNIVISHDLIASSRMLGRMVF